MVIIINMDSLIETAVTFRDQRDAYAKIVVKKRKVEEDKKKLNIKNNKLKNGKYVVLSDNELNNFGENIIEEYSVNGGKNYNDYFGGIPYHISNICMRNYVGNLGKHSEVKPSHEKRQKEKLDAGVNCKNQYYNCIEKIKSFGISIYSVSKQLDKFYNGGVSCVMGGCDCFVFKCMKNNYKFTIIFDDDADCIPGILGVRNVVNINTNEKVKFYCDLYCQNTGIDKLNQFFDIVNNNKENYNKTFDHYFKLPELLQKDGIVVNVVNNCGDDYDINSYTIKYYMKISWYDVELVLYPYRYGKNYSLFVSTLQNFGKGDNAYKINKIDTKYNSVDNYKLLLKNLGLYVSYINGNYGYFDDDKYYNNVDIQKNYDEKYKNLGHLIITTETNVFNEIQFDTLIICNFGDKFIIDHKICNDDFNIDEYYVRFWCNSNDNKCFLLIKGAYCNYTQLYADYDKTNNENNIIINEICDDLMFEGSFGEMLDIMNVFLDKLVSIYPIKENKLDNRYDDCVWECGSFE